MIQNNSSTVIFLGHCLFSNYPVSIKNQLCLCFFISYSIVWKVGRFMIFYNCLTLWKCRVSRFNMPIKYLQFFIMWYALYVCNIEKMPVIFLFSKLFIMSFLSFTESNVKSMNIEMWELNWSELDEYSNIIIIIPIISPS